MYKTYLELRYSTNNGISSKFVHLHRRRACMYERLLLHHCIVSTSKLHCDRDCGYTCFVLLYIYFKCSEYGKRLLLQSFIEHKEYSGVKEKYSLLRTGLLFFFFYSSLSLLSRILLIFLQFQLCQCSGVLELLKISNHDTNGDLYFY